MLNQHDHRQIARDQKLLHFQDEAPGMVFWHPRGLALLRALERAARGELERHGYREVRTPEVLQNVIWQRSGHALHFVEGMFPIDTAPLERESEHALALRPVNCPGHVQIYAEELRSYRELPMRLAEFGVVHRREPSGALSGLFRLREFTQDDGHVFCRPDQVQDELVRFCDSLRSFYRRFGFDDIIVGWSTRPRERIGDDASWDRAERLLRDAAIAVGFDVQEQPGEGAFYGPKLEFKLLDRLGRIWQCGTIQLDFAMPERFGLCYVDSDGQRRRPVMLHRALYGSLERFLGVLLEHHAGKLPAWLAPEQAHVLAISPSEAGAADALIERLRRLDVRVAATDPDERVAARVQAASRAGVPFVLVIGPREAASGAVSVSAGGVTQVEPIELAVRRIADAARGLHEAPGAEG
jgi:threonyl-tRNA synthetase